MGLSTKQLNKVAETVESELSSSYSGAAPVEYSLDVSEESFVLSVNESMGEGDFGSAVEYVDGMVVKFSPSLSVEVSVQESSFYEREISIDMIVYR